MRYYVQYLKTANVHLVKDMGMIPFKLHQLFHYDSTIATYKNGEYPYLNAEVKGLKIDFIPKSLNNYTLDGSRHLIKRAKTMDVLQLFHMTLSSIFYALTFKCLNPKGKVYLKLDCSELLIKKLEGFNSIQALFMNRFLKNIDLISVEQKQLHSRLQEIWSEHRNKIIHIPNGVDFQWLKENNISFDYQHKENIILNVARIGAAEKNTPMILEAFSKVKNIENSNWKLVLVGSIEPDFHSYIEAYFQRNPLLKDRVIFKGNIEDRQALYQEYAKAKIFTLTSDFESFGIALIEAAALGDTIISTDVGIAKELVQKGNGKLVPCRDTIKLTEALTEFINKEDSELESLCQETFHICKENYDWNTIIQKLHEHIGQLYRS